VHVVSLDDTRAPLVVSADARAEERCVVWVVRWVRVGLVGILALGAPWHAASLRAVSPFESLRVYSLSRPVGHVAWLHREGTSSVTGDSFGTCCAFRSITC